MTGGGDHYRRMRGIVGLRYVATDQDRAWGEGPEVRAPSDALLLVLTGRQAGLEHASGAGVDELRTRLEGPASA